VLNFHARSKARFTLGWYVQSVRLSKVKQ